jgi:flagellar motor switch protein FliN/FliY
MTNQAESGPNEVKPSSAATLQAGTAATGAAAASGVPVDPANVDSLLDQAQAALAGIDEPAAPLPPGVKPFEFANLAGAAPVNEPASLDLLRDVQLDLKIELGRTRMHLEDVLRLNGGAVVTLDKLAGDPVDIYANGRLIARGEVLVLNDNFCVRVTELISEEQDSAA